MTGSPASTAVLGKVPWHPEFLSASQLSTDLWAFDQWLFRNAQSPMTGRGASYGFLLQLGSSNATSGVLAGILSPSHDAAGRSYPLAVAGHVLLARDVAAHPETLPIVFEDYWHTAVDILREAREGRPVGDDWRLERLSQTPRESGESALALYVEWAERMDAPQLCSLLGRPPDWLPGAVATIARAVGPKAGARARSVRVPLGLAAGGALCFWLDVVRRAAGWQQHVPSFFWSHDEQSGDALLFVAAPGDTALATLWGGDATPDDVCDVTAHVGPSGTEPHPAMAMPVSIGGSEDGVWRVLESIEILVKAQTT